MLKNVVSKLGRRDMARNIKDRIFGVSRIPYAVRNRSAIEIKYILNYICINKVHGFGGEYMLHKMIYLSACVIGLTRISKLIPKISYTTISA